MTLIKRNGNLFNQLPRLFDDMVNRDMFDWNNDNFSETNTTIPAVNIKETPEDFEVIVAAPGLTKDDFKIELEGTTLTIRSEQSPRNETQDVHFALREFSYQSFQRTFNLEQRVVNPDGIEAKYDNGLLRIRIPKKEEVKQKPPRLIEIS